MLPGPHLPRTAVPSPGSSRCGPWRGLLAGGLVLGALAGCAFTTATPVARSDLQARGIRVYDPRPLLVVTDKEAGVVFVPDFERGYAVRFHAFLSRNDVKLEMHEGLLTKLSSRLDATSLTTLLETLGREALEQAPRLAALGGPVRGTLEGRQGIYSFEFDEQGRLVGLRRIELGP